MTGNSVTPANHQQGTLRLRQSSTTETLLIQALAGTGKMECGLAITIVTTRAFQAQATHARISTTWADRRPNAPKQIDGCWITFSAPDDRHVGDDGGSCSGLNGA